jgi:hypothetical protein
MNTAERVRELESSRDEILKMISSNADLLRDVCKLLTDLHARLEEAEHELAFAREVPDDGT